MIIGEDLLSMSKQMRLAPKPAADSQQSDGKTRPRWTNFYLGNENHHKCLAGVPLKQNRFPKGA